MEHDTHVGVRQEQPVKVFGVFEEFMARTAQTWCVTVLERYRARVENPIGIEVQRDRHGEPLECRGLDAHLLPGLLGPVHTI